MHGTLSLEIRAWYQNTLEEKIEVKPEEIQERIGAMAAQYGVEPQEMKTRMAKENMLEGLQSQVQAEKTLDFLLEQAKVKR